MDFYPKWDKIFTIMLTYQEALNFIYSFVDQEKALIAGPSRFDLQRMVALLDLLGNPHRRYQAIHIAGTKGKGSTAAMIESILRAGGYKTGLFTSPHLHTYRERIRVAGRPMREEEMMGQVERLIPVAKKVPELTTFEVTTALAFSHFVDQKVDWAILEVGLGGRLDATNIIDPAVTVLTFIGYDHTEVLGHRLAEIAREKAGIIKRGRPVISAPQRPTALRAIKKACQERGAPLTLVGEEWSWERQGFDLEGQGLSLRRDSKDLYPHLWIPFLGLHQLTNAATAVATIEKLKEGGLSLLRGSVEEGLRRASWPGRLEVLGRKPLLVMDGAHNVDSARALAQALSEYFSYKSLIFVLGFSLDKDIRGMLRQLLPLAQEVMVTKSQHPRAVEPERLRALVAAQGRKALASESVEEALWRALGLASEEDLVCVTGSLFVVAEARAAWLESQEIEFEKDPAPL